MLIVGLTGRIASGKSTVAKKFKELGINIISADYISKKLTNSNTKVLQQITNYFGKSILQDDGRLNRKKLRDIIFQEKTKRLWLENLLHPLIRQEIERKLKECTSEYCIVEIPLLTDTSMYPYLNRILLITSDENTQIKRLLARDNITKEDALLILNNQAPEAIYRKIADDIIENNASMNDLNNQVLKLHQKYLSIIEKQ